MFLHHSIEHKCRTEDDQNGNLQCLNYSFIALFIRKSIESISIANYLLNHKQFYCKVSPLSQVICEYYHYKTVQVFKFFYIGKEKQHFPA